MDSKQRWKEKNPNYQKEYYEKNKESINKQKKECREKRKEHYSEVAKIRYAERREGILSKGKEHRLAFPEKALLASAKQRSKRKGMAFDIEVSDIQIPEICPLLGIPLSQTDGKVSFNSPTIDRIDPNKGYTKGNVWVISFKANMIKNCASFEEFQTIAENWKKLTMKTRNVNDR